MFELVKYIDKVLFLKINSLHAPLLDELIFYSSQNWVFTPLFFYWFFLVYKSIGIKKISIFIISIFLLVLLTDQTTNQIKHAVKRYRPTHNKEIQAQVHTVKEYRGGEYGFFSSHAANTFGVAMFLFLLLKEKSLLFRSQFFIWASFIGYSRIYLGVHYPSDIFMGILVGLFWGFIVYKLIQKILKKYYHEIPSI